ncbi:MULTISPECIES: gluconate:H+ symporter [Heyndrickxia]|jgi:high-affinity gluconate transporter|uniref:gluconate:H+ symporter n=1 Tax=Heyndrickxia TaxID=2837504 RepID=UPI000D7384EE|nr:MULTISPECIES: gluconate:H+ symporter [Heyndrickxia]AWP37894.1 gluconate permease [Heyndrickxia coagulans]MBQ4909835.1 gluconate permease [Heyndrickxia faecalis]QDI60208.1 gluconate permease [Heyndrickxia coagulans]UXC21673.1 gluconate:H+ symporter [Heyndrickxia coagulans]
MDVFFSFLWVALGILLLLLFNLKYKMHNILALLLVALFVGLMERMDIGKIATTIESGVGSTMGSLALIVALGAIIGKLMTESGASQRIATTIIDKFGIKYLQWALVLIGIIFGMAMFYEVAFLIAAPLVISIAKEAKIPYMKLIIPTVTGATMGHSLFPPQPGPMALVSAFNVDVGQVYIIGAIVIIPSVICAGIILPKFLRNLDKLPLADILKAPKKFTEEEMPKFGTSLLVPLIPAIIMVISSIVKFFTNENSMLYKLVLFFGSAEVSMTIALLVGMYFFGIKRGMDGQTIQTHMSKAISEVANVILVIAAGGAFKQIIIDSGVGNNIVKVMEHSSLSPLILAWILTVVIRLMTGQGAVSAITVAGIMQPMLSSFNVSPVLMLLAIACGSNTITLMYDGGFLLFQQTLGISMKDTFKTWGLLELVNSVVGLIVCLLLSIVI